MVWNARTFCLVDYRFVYIFVLLCPQRTSKGRFFWAPDFDGAKSSGKVEASYTNPTISVSDMMATYVSQLPFRLSCDDSEPHILLLRLAVQFWVALKACRWHRRCQMCISGKTAVVFDLSNCHMEVMEQSYSFKWDLKLSHALVLYLTSKQSLRLAVLEGLIANIFERVPWDWHNQFNWHRQLTPMSPDSTFCFQFPTYTVRFWNAENFLELERAFKADCITKLLSLRHFFYAGKLTPGDPTWGTFLTRSLSTDSSAASVPRAQGCTRASCKTTGISRSSGKRPRSSPLILCPSHDCHHDGQLLRE
jgi:hypothetical protein